VVTKERRDFDGNSGGDGQSHGQHSIALTGKRRGGATSNNYQLLPETLGIFDGKLTRNGIQIAQSLDSHQKGFVLIQTSLAEGFNLAAKMIFKFINVGRANRWPFFEIIAPLPDTLFESWFTHQTVTPFQPR